MPNENPPIGQIIATREYEVVRADGTTEIAQVRLGKPIKAATSDYWQCPYEIQSQSFERRFYSAGEDSMQALILALHILDTEISSLAKKHDARFLHYGASELGLPAIANVPRI